ncbi:MAG: NAD(P)-dependent oxidoreductase, partial [Acidimicrobiales bacterium]
MNILCADALADDLLAPLRESGHTVIVEADLSADTIPARLAAGDFEVLVVRSTKVTAEAFAATTALGLVVRAGAGTDNVDKDAASASGVYVSNVPGRNAVAVAELAMALLLAIDRHIAPGMADLRAGTWNKGQYSKADGILGKQLAIIGLGEIGFALADRARAFGMTVTALRKADRSDESLNRIRAAGVRLVDDMATLLGEADVVSLHVPSAKGTVGMVDADFLSAMKPGSILINTARGDAIQGEALIEAMNTHGIRAGLDVWPDEPSGKQGEWTSDLASHPNVVGTHH